MLTDDLSDYTTSDEEIERNLRESEGCEDESRLEQIHSAGKRKAANRNKYQRALSFREQWADYTAKNCTENNLYGSLLKILEVN